MAKPTFSIAELRRCAIRQTLFAPTHLRTAVQRLGFVQADPLRAPARAQDLILRPRVRGYCAGDLDRRYRELPVSEDFLINYGYVRDDLHALMHPRMARHEWSPQDQRRAAEVLAFVSKRGCAHPREVEAHFAHGRMRNWFGGHSNVTTQLMERMHYRGLLSVLRREGGTRVYCLRQPTPPALDPALALDTLVDAVVMLYAPLPRATLGQLVSMLGGGAPQWRAQRGQTLARAMHRLPHTEVDGTLWFWHERTPLRRARGSAPELLRILAPFDPLVWDRRRFEQLWGWSYRFEAYLPASQRQRGHYAMPLLWRDQVIGWVNGRVVQGVLQLEPGFIAGQAPRERAFAQAWHAEAADLARCVGAADWHSNL